MNFAIDITLLPPEEVMQKAIQINESFKNKKIDFKRELPHISMLMGVIKEDRISEVMSLLGETMSDQKPLNLQVTHIQEITNQIGETISSFQIKNTPELQSLHERLAEMIEPYFQKDIDVNMLCESPHAEQRHLDYIQNFVQSASFQNFDPHITLGAGKVNKTEVNFTFQTSRLALCHLGDYCTCRRIFGECELV